MRPVRSHLTEKVRQSSLCLTRRAFNSQNSKILESLSPEVLFNSENAANDEKSSKVEIIKSRREVGRPGASFSENVLGG